MSERIAIVGMWHLGCSIAASWLSLHRPVTAIEFDPTILNGLLHGQAPVREPGVDEKLMYGFSQLMLTVSPVPSAVSGHSFVFIAFDTPVTDDDVSDITPITQAIEQCGPHLDEHAIVIISSQLPVGSARVLRTRLKELAPTAELVYSPENLRLGEAMKCYLYPNNIVVGSESADASAKVEALFQPMGARIWHMNLPSAEMTKHCINSFLATSVTLANQWADIAMATGADYGKIAEVLRMDPRIGSKAYITPGIGFSGGTIGRDLRVLESKSRELLDNNAPMFGQIWEYNSHRPSTIVAKISELIGGVTGKRIALLGMTYKPGTSTLRRSLPLAIAQELLAQHAIVTVHDPMADWSDVDMPPELVVMSTPYDAVYEADIVVLLTEWPEYKSLDFAKLASTMNSPIVFDTKNFLQNVVGMTHIILGQGNI